VFYFPPHLIPVLLLYLAIQNKPVCVHDRWFHFVTLLEGYQYSS